MASTDTADSGGRRLRYVDVRPYAIPDELRDLAGPTGGELSLPRALAWGPRRSFDLDDLDQRQRIYEIVLQEASAEAELGRYLNRALLTDLWPQLVLPARCRQQWEERFPELARRAVA